MRRARYARWTLLVLTVLFTLFGVGDLLIGPSFDPGITLGVAGVSLEQLRTESEAGYRMLDFYTRMGGVHLIAMGLALTVLLLVPYREGRRWAWWTMWLFPGWIALSLALELSFGVAPGQAPPPPMVSGPILAALAAVALLGDRTRFFAARDVERATQAAPAA
jgi:hypothetical protein